ncbi:MAG: hypothetical protein RIR66_444 [Actinomycetota bacterium]
MAYGARLESGLGASPQGFKSPILRHLSFYSTSQKETDLMFNSIFVNLPVADLKKSVEFFTGLGFTFNAQFTSDESTCMIVNEQIYVMLLVKEKFASFIDKKVAERDTSEAILSFSCKSREEVDSIAKKAFELGARRVNDPEDIGFMYSWAFEDLDGHLWDLFWMDPSHIQ